MPPTDPCCFGVLELLGIESATRDHALVDAWRYLLRHRANRRTALPDDINLSFPVATLVGRSSAPRTRARRPVDRRALEVCVFSHIADALQSGRSVRARLRCL